MSLYSVRPKGDQHSVIEHEKMSVTTVKLLSGHEVPILGLGCWLAKGDEVERAIDAALEAGYRHIDTATMYENEKQIGNVLKKWLDSGKIKREELFIVTKVPPTGVSPKGVRIFIQQSLEDLQLDYIDLYLVHCPFALQYVEGNYYPRDDNGDMLLDCGTDLVAVWTEMENQVKEGRARSIGLSNFNISQIQRILDHATVPVSMLQIELHLYFQQKELVEFCNKKGIAVTAYCPLGSRAMVDMLNLSDKMPDLLENPTVNEIAKNKGKTAAQVLLRHIVQKGIITIPKSTNPNRIRENIDVFSWKLDDDEMDCLNNLDRGNAARIVIFVGIFPGVDRHPEFPFPDELKNRC